MSTQQSTEYLTDLVHALCARSREIEWLEFKMNNATPEEIGEYISALANTAALQRRPYAYLVWGVENETHRIVGTTFSPQQTKVGNEELENWLLHLLEPSVHIRFLTGVVDGQPVVLLQIARAARQPVRFKGQEFVRVGSYKKRLKDFTEKERELWRIFDQTPFEELIAAERLTADEVLRRLDYPAYFDMLARPLPENRNAILDALADDRLVRKGEAGEWDITNLGAILFAKRLEDFSTLRRKALRVIKYRGDDRLETLREQVAANGYACGFREAIGNINGLVPSNEVIERDLRRSVPMFPELAVRELVANALIHQDFSATGAGPMVEIFDTRIEITNPGAPLVDTQRFVDTPPKSRNETLASLMRRLGICEERGSGIDKVVFQVEFYQLPAPLFEAPDGFTRTILFAHKALSAMDKDDRVRACYLHACLKYVTRAYLTNASLRERFGIAEKNSAIASRLIKEAVAAGAIFPYDRESSRKLMKYVPWWAAGRVQGA